MILLNPGPVVLSAAVRAALAKPAICHREPEFADLQDRIRSALIGVYDLDPERWAAVLLSGSGTAAVEAMLISLAPAAGRLLILSNGTYGERMAQIARSHTLECSVLSFSWHDAVDLQQVEQRLAEDSTIRHVAVVHHETSSGRRNDIETLGALCRRFDASLLVDGVSSFAGERLDFEGWNIGACAASAGKCLHAAPGMAFVIARRDQLSDGPSPQRSVYLDLNTYCRHQDAGDTPFTPAVPLFYALDAALDELRAQGGWEARHRHYRRYADRIRQGLLALGLQPLLAAGDSSVVLQAWHQPEPPGYEALHDGLKARGFVIYGAPGALARRVFRVATLGAVSGSDIERFLAAVDNVLGAVHPPADAR